MKPCEHNKQPIVWLTLDALDADAAKALKVHLTECAGCAQYFAEVGAVRRDYEKADDGGVARPLDESFHRQLKLRIEADAARPALGQIVEAFWRRITRPTLPQALATASVAVAVVLASVWLGRHEPHVSVSAPPSNPISQNDTSVAASRTLSSYHRIVNTSPEALDDLLTRQAAGNASPDHPLTFSVSSRREMEN